jgi:hypothetical protein
MAFVALDALALAVGSLLFLTLLVGRRVQLAVRARRRRRAQDRLRPVALAIAYGDDVSLGQLISTHVDATLFAELRASPRSSRAAARSSSR